MKKTEFYNDAAQLKQIRKHALEFDDARIKKIHGLVEGKRILDMGCSDGTVSSALVKKGKEVSGVDISKKAVAMAAKRGIIARVCDIESQDLPFKNNYFDCVIAGEVIEHMFDTDEFIEKCKKALKTDGILIITVPNSASLRARLSLLFGRQPAWVEHRAKGGSGHIRAYTLKGLLSQMREHGLKVEEVRSSVVNVPFIGSSSALGDRLPSLGDVLIVKARK